MCTQRLIWCSCGHGEFLPIEKCRRAEKTGYCWTVVWGDHEVMVEMPCSYCKEGTGRELGSAMPRPGDEADGLRKKQKEKKRILELAAAAPSISFPTGPSTSQAEVCDEGLDGIAVPVLPPPTADLFDRASHVLPAPTLSSMVLDPSLTTGSSPAEARPGGGLLAANTAANASTATRALTNARFSPPAPPPEPDELPLPEVALPTPPNEWDDVLGTDWGGGFDLPSNLWQYG